MIDSSVLNHSLIEEYPLT